MDKQAKEAKELVKQMTFTQKIKHFWDYYKIHTIVTLVVLMLIGVTVYQVVSNKEYDLPIEFFGEKMITDEQAAALESYVTYLMSNTFSTRSDFALPIWAGAVILVLSAAIIIWYFIIFPRRVFRREAKENLSAKPDYKTLVWKE